MNPRKYKGGVTPERLAKTLLRRVKPFTEKKPKQDSEDRSLRSVERKPA